MKGIRHIMKRTCASLLLCILLLTFSLPLLAVDGKKAEYVGGTVNSIPEGTEGVLDTKNENKVGFAAKKANWDVPYSQITGLEYGQKAGRRVGVAIAVSPIALFSKKRKHYLTINYKDTAGKDQAVVFEIGKDIVRTTLTIMETRSGKQIEYQDDEARKAGKGND
jgi:hypothetical protein